MSGDSEDFDGSDEELLDSELLLAPSEPSLFMAETCVVPDLDALHLESGAEGVIAVQYIRGELFYLDGETRKWVNVEKESGKPKGLKSVN